MANVMFKRGLQSSLDDLQTSQIVDGAFYLTTDTNRLYVGTNASLELLNQGVKVYDSWDTISALKAPLTAEGQFYYAKKENILCAYSNDQWVQINPDHNDNDDTSVTGIAVSKSLSEDGEQLIYDITLTQQKKDAAGTNVDDAYVIKSSFAISKTDIGEITTDTSVGIKAEDAIKGITLKLDGVGANADQTINIAGSGATTVGTDESGNVTISSTDTTYTGEVTAEGTFVLKDAAGTGQGSITIAVDGATGLSSSIAGGKDGSITIAHNSTLAEATSTQASLEGRKLSIPTLDINRFGHVTNVGSAEIELPADVDTKVTGVSINENGQIIVTSSDGATSTPVSSEEIIKYDITVDGKATSVKVGGELGSFYSASQVDKLITNAKADMDAMTYRGVVDTDTVLAGKNPQKGDTFKAGAIFTLNGKSVNTGDLIIYNGVDVTGDGANYDDTKWEIIPSGDDIDTQYELSLSGTDLKLTNTTDKTTVNTITVAGDGEVIASNEEGKLKLSHAQPAGLAAGSFAAAAGANTITVPSFSYDAYGHITGKGEDVTFTVSDKDTTYKLVGEQTESKVSLVAVGDGNPYGSIKIGADAQKTVTVGCEVDAQGTGTEFTIGLPIIEQAPEDTQDAVNVGPDGEASFTAYKPVVDNYGRITGLQAQTLSIDNKTEYSLESAIENNTLAITSKLKDSASKEIHSGSIKISSSSLKIAKTGDVCSVELEWGSF